MPLSFRRAAASGLAVLLTGVVAPLVGTSVAAAAGAAPVIAYIAVGDGGSSGVLMRPADGSGEPTVLVPEDAAVDGAEGQFHSELTVSRDGSRIAYVAVAFTDADGDVSAKLVVQDLRAGSVPVTLVELPVPDGELGASVLDSAAFSPDGTTITYGGGRRYDDADERVKARLYRVPVTGGTPVTVPVEDDALLEATYTPGGSLLGFTDVGLESNRLATVPAGGGAPVAVEGVDSAKYLEVAFSPDGKRITWTQCDDGAPGTRFQCFGRVYVASWTESGSSATVGTPTPITPAAAVGQEHDYYTPTFTLDGQDVVAVLWDHDGDVTEADLVRVPVTGGTPVTIASTPALEFESAVGVTPSASSCASGFVDVAADHPFCADIAWMAAQGISTGTTMPDGTVEYRPALAVSRQAMAPFLYRAAGSPDFAAPATASFADVPTTHPFFREIEWMRAEGISTGTAQPTGLPLYKPSDPVSRQAMAPFLYRAAGSPSFAPPTTASFADVPTTHPFFREIEWMRAEGISTGTAQPTGPPLYKPADAVSRQAMAAFLRRAADQ